MAGKIPFGGNGGSAAEWIGCGMQQFWFVVFDGLVLVFVNPHGGIPFVGTHIDAVANDAGISGEVGLGQFDKIG